MLLFCLTAWWNRGSMMTVVVIGLLASVATRAMILSIIDVTAFFVFTPSYQAPAHGLLLAAAMLSLADGATAVRDRIRLSRLEKVGPLHQKLAVEQTLVSAD
jgi:hypothetical protein